MTSHASVPSGRTFRTLLLVVAIVLAVLGTVLPCLGVILSLVLDVIDLPIGLALAGYVLFIAGVVMFVALLVTSGRRRVPTFILGASIVVLAGGLLLAVFSFYIGFAIADRADQPESFYRANNLLILAGALFFVVGLVVGVISVVQVTRRPAGRLVPATYSLR